MTITPGMRGIDFAFMPDHEDGYAGIAKNKAGYVCRYSAGVDGASNDKCVKPGEVAEAAGHGLDFIANFELAHETPEEGAQSGRRHGAADRDFWDARGLAPGAGVIISWEPGKDRSKYDAVAAFLEGFREALGRPVGLYAGVHTLVEMRRRGLIDYTWLCMSSDASELNFGQIPQSDYAARMLQLGRDNGVNMVQNRNVWYDGRADEDIIVNLPSVHFSHLQALHGGPVGAHVAVAHSNLLVGMPWPGPELGFGPKDHFGNINGPAQSHGGATPQERTFVKLIQQRLIVSGFVNGHADPNDGWADGIFDIKGDGRLDGPTTTAVRRFQAARRPGPLTTRPGEIWPDDWKTLFS